MAGALVILLLGSSVAWWVLRSRGEGGKGTAAHDDASRRVLVVLPFESISKDRSRDYFSAGLTEEMNGQLSKVSALQVISRTALAKYKDPRANLHQIATDLGIGSAIIGSVRQEGSRVRIHLEIVDPKSDRTVWSEQYDRELKDIFEVQTEAALRVADVLKARLSPNEQALIERRPTENIAAYELYLRSQELPHSDHKKNLSAVGMLQQALQIDPRFAVAEAAMAYRTVFEAYWEKSGYVDSGMEMARKALVLDPDLAEAHVALALGYYLKGQGSNARLSLLKAIELNPNHGGAMMNLSLLESETGHYDEALHWARLGLRLEPNSGVAYFHVGIPLLFLGNDAVTEKWLTEAEYLFPASMRLQILLAILDFQRGRDQNALQRIRQAATAQPRNEELQNLEADLALISGVPDAEKRVERLFRSAPDLSASSMVLLESSRTRYAYLLARRGEKTRAAQLMEQAASLAQQTVQQGNDMPRVRLEIAALNAMLRQKEVALQWLQQAYDAGYRDPRTLVRDPMFENVREEPKFKELLGRMEKDVGIMRQRSSDVH